MILTKRNRAYLISRPRCRRLPLLFTLSVLLITISHSEAAIIVLCIGGIGTLVVLLIAAQNK